MGTHTPPAAPRRSGPATLFRVLRIVLPAVATAIVLIAVFWPQIAPEQGRFGVKVIPADQTEGASGEAAVDASYSGVDREGRPFTVTAKSVRNDPALEHVLLLTKPDAKIDLKDATTMTIAADTGTFNRERHVLDLDGHVTLNRGADMTAETSRATIDLDTGSAEGAEPVQGRTGFGRVTGTGFRIIDNGKTVFVNGPARMIINPDAQPRLP